MSLEAEGEFCLNFLKKVDAAKTGTICSPVSLLNSLAMIYAGSDRNTAEEIAKVIGKDNDKAQIIRYYSEFCRRFNDNNDDCEEISCESSSSTQEEEQQPIKESDGKNKIESESKSESESLYDAEEVEDDEDNLISEDDSAPDFKLVNINRMLVGNGIKIHPLFETTICDHFFTGVQRVNFSESKTVEIINNFIKDTTCGKIEKIIEPDSLSRHTSCVLVNAIYFIGKWYNSFKPRFNAPFYSNPPRENEFMTENLHLLNFTEGSTWKACGIPYKGHKYWMFIILPKKESNLEDLVASMDYSMFLQWTKKSPAALNLTIPIFEISSDYDLTQILPSLGIKELYDSKKCNLSRMFVSSHIIDKSLHKATIKVDEYGTEASAATYSAMCPRSGKALTKFIADCPFLFFIVAVDDETSSDSNGIRNILFSGTFL